MNFDVVIQADTATPALEAQLKAADPHRVATKITPPLTRHIRDNFLSLPKNKNGYPSTGYFEKAARSTVGVAVGGDCIITSGQIGLRQRLRGGVITARNVQNITIPICAEAYGTTVADWGFDNLVLVILADGRKFLALWLGNENAQASFEKNISSKKLTKRAEATANRVNKFRSAVGEQKKPKVIIFKGKGTGSNATQIARIERHSSPQLLFLFVLKKSVNQSGNPLVIPQDLQEFAVAEVREAIQA